MIGGWTTLDTWIVVIGVLVAASCGLLGCFLVLRRMSMMGDAISHAVLPGLAVAFMLTASRDGVTMFVGAAVVGVLTAVLTQAIHHWARVDINAAMGVVFTTLFAIGLILIVRGADKVDLDPGCVLYGAIEAAPLDTWSVLGWAIPRAAVVMGVMGAIDALFVIVFFKELRITCFDPALAGTLGMRPVIVHYTLMVLIAATTVAAFEAVGSILVVAMLIVPGATASLLTDRLPTMLVVCVLIAAAGAAAGHLAAITVPGWIGFTDTNTAGMMVVVTGALFVLTVAAAPRYGAVARVVARVLLSLRIVGEDVLGFLYRVDELGLRGRTLLTSTEIADAVGARPILVRMAIRRLTRTRRIDPDAEGGIGLTDRGRAEATRLVRTHRLWETYLARHLQVPVDHVHAPAMALEHVTDAAMTERLEAEAPETGLDPHGRQVPG